MKKTILLLLSSFFISTSFAASVEKDINVSSTVEKVCYLSAKDIVLGNIPITGYSGYHGGFISYTCSTGVVVSLTLNGNKDEVGRYMKVGENGEDKLRYRFMIGGRTPTPRFMEAETFAYVRPVSIDSTVVVDANQYVAPGNYVDQLTVDISY